MKISNFQFPISKHILDLIFPRFCIGCNREGFDLCDSCELGLVPRPKQHGPVGELDGLLTLVPYGDPIVRGMLGAYKYDRVRSLEDKLTLLLRRFLAASPHLVPVADLIIPVPLHWYRERERGFNQTTLIAQIIAGTLHVPTEECLRRTRRTEFQSHLAHDSNVRAENVRDAFGLDDPESMRRKRVLLVDDVATSGKTMDACARVLKQAGATSVWGFAVARG